jgi:hypothetical protein
MQLILHAHRGCGGCCIATGVSKMNAVPLTVAKITCKVDVAPKSLLYYGRREAFGAKYYPSQYPDWQFGPTTLILVDHKNLKRMTVDPSYLRFDVATPKDILTLRKHILAAIDEYLNSVVAGSEPTRFGWAVELVAEGTSFTELLPIVRAAVCPEAFSWWRVDGYSNPRDFAATAYLGREDDGLNASVSVLTPEQSVALISRQQFKQVEVPLAIADGTLVLEMDRYVTNIKKRDIFERIVGEHQNIVKAAEQIAQRIFATHLSKEQL